MNRRIPLGRKKKELFPKGPYQGKSLEGKSMSDSDVFG